MAIKSRGQKERQKAESATDLEENSPSKLISLWCDQDRSSRTGAIRRGRASWLSCQLSSSAPLTRKVWGGDPRSSDPAYRANDVYKPQGNLILWWEGSSSVVPFQLFTALFLFSMELISPLWVDMWCLPSPTTNKIPCYGPHVLMAFLCYLPHDSSWAHEWNQGIIKERHHKTLRCFWIINGEIMLSEFILRIKCIFIWSSALTANTDIAERDAGWLAVKRIPLPSVGIHHLQ